MQNILLLHGALGCSKQFDLLKSGLEEKYKAYTLDFGGHGGKAFPEQGFSIQHFAQNVTDFLAQENITSTDIFGYSMGGYVALYLASQKDIRIQKIITLATKMDWTPESAAKETRMLDSDKIEAKLPAFAADLQSRFHPQNWKTALQHTAGMMLALGNEPPLTDQALAEIEIPVKLCVGDSDRMVSIEETVSTFRKIKGAQLAVFPNTFHPLEQVSLERLTNEIIN